MSLEGTLTATGQAPAPIYAAPLPPPTTQTQTQGSVTAAPITNAINTITTANVPTSTAIPNAPNSTGNFAQMLAQMFAQHQTPTAAPTWQPGMNPFAGSYSAQTAPSTQLTGQFAAPTNPLAQQTTSSLQGWLANPSSFGTPQVQQSYDYLSQNIDDDFAQQQTQLEEEMARRGLAASSIRGGRLSDLNVGRKSAKEQLANNLLYQQAQTGGQDRANAISAAMGYGGQAFSQGLESQGLQADINNQNFQQALAVAAFQGDQNAQAILQNMTIAGFNNNVTNQGFQNQLASYGATQTGNQQNFSQQQQLLANMLGYDQSQFTNQLSTWNANQGASQWYQQLQAWLASQGAGA